MDYCVRESAFSPECEHNDVTIKMDIQETTKILREMYCTLNDFASIINGKVSGENNMKDANNLGEEAHMMTTFAYDCLQKLNEIKRSII